MKTKITLAALLCCGFLSNAQANNHTISVGYAQSKVEYFKNINGVNLQYRYEWDSPVSVISSFSYMEGDSTNTHLTSLTRTITHEDTVKYYSLLAGPAYRINDYISVYGLLGAAHVKSENKRKSVLGNATYSDKSTQLAYAAGIAINPLDSLSVNIGYEGTKVDGEYGNYSINGFNVGVGYRF